MSGSGDKKQLGKILLKQKLVSPTDLVDGVEEPRSNPGLRPPPPPPERRGAPSTVDTLKSLSDRFGVPAIDLGQVVIPLENLDLVPADIARQHLILPVVVKEDRIVLAMANPGATRSIDEIEFVTGRRVFPYVTIEESLAAAIAEAYRLKDAKKSYYVGADVSPELLASRGITPDEASIAARAPRSADDSLGVVVDRRVTDSTPPMDDELGLGAPDLAALRAPSKSESPALDDAFGSRVGPLPDEPKARPGTPKILVVDDEDDIRKLLGACSASAATRSSRRRRACDALQLVRDHVPDVILLDAMLPEVHGFDICRRIKGIEALRAHPDHHGERDLPRLALRRGSPAVVRRVRRSSRSRSRSATSSRRRARARGSCGDPATSDDLSARRPRPSRARDRPRTAQATSRRRSTS